MTADRAGMSKEGTKKEVQVSPMSRNVYCDYYDFSILMQDLTLTHHTSCLLFTLSFKFTFQLAGGKACWQSFLFLL